MALYTYFYSSIHGLSAGTNIHHCHCLKLKLNSFLLWARTNRETGDRLLKPSLSLPQHEHCLPGLGFIQLIYSWQQIWLFASEQGKGTGQAAGAWGNAGREGLEQNW